MRGKSGLRTDGEGRKRGSKGRPRRPRTSTSVGQADLATPQSSSCQLVQVFELRGENPGDGQKLRLRDGADCLEQGPATLPHDTEVGGSGALRRRVPGGVRWGVTGADRPKTARSSSTAMGGGSRRGERGSVTVAPRFYTSLVCPKHLGHLEGGTPLQLKNNNNKKTTRNSLFSCE